jgi:ornithine cyclodeaminase/alanine dehydrogenase-like protein (mu-crystallin family)
MSGRVVSKSAGGLKWFTVPDKHRPRDLPHVPAYIIISDPKTGLLDAMMDATFLTVDRTAAVGVRSAFACARRPLRNRRRGGARRSRGGEVLGGADGIERVTVASRTTASAQEVCRQLTFDLGEASGRPAMSKMPSSMQM